MIQQCFDRSSWDSDLVKMGSAVLSILTGPTPLSDSQTSWLRVAAVVVEQVDRHTGSPNVVRVGFRYLVTTPLATGCESSGLMSNCLRVAKKILQVHDSQADIAVLGLQLLAMVAARVDLGVDDEALVVSCTGIAAQCMLLHICN